MSDMCSVSGLSDMGMYDMGHTAAHSAAHSAAHPWRHSVGAAAAPPPTHRTTKSWFDPLYIEDPLRPSNNVGRNCFRVYTVLQEFSKAHALCTAQQSDDFVGDREYPILSRVCQNLAM
eukprot:1884025-Prymnesium_polylepis.1